MSTRLWWLAVLASCMVACAGCMGTHRASRANAARANAPDDVGLRADPNAPYILAGGSPRLIPRATALDAQNAGRCDPEVLSVEEISGDMNGIFRSVKLAFMNRGTVPCRLGGYPQVALLNSSGEVIGSVTTEKISSAEVVAELGKAHVGAVQESAPEITLMPHAVAAFQVVWTSGSNCSSAAQMLVRAPATERAFTIAQPIRICAGRIQVTALRLDEGDV